MKTIERIRVLEKQLQEQADRTEQLEWTVKHLSAMCAECIDKYNNYTDALTMKALENLKKEMSYGPRL